MRLLVFQHLDCEHPGQLRTYLHEDNIEWTTVELDTGQKIPELGTFDGLWVMGGPMDVWDVEQYPWLIEEKRAIRTWVRELRRPFLGFCLGHQLLADSLGGTCASQLPPEIGVLSVELTQAGIADPIFAGVPSTHIGLQWHSVQVTQPPEDAIVLAKSPECAVQSMRVGPHAWSMQYHVEVEADTVPTWGSVPEYRRSLESALGPDSLDELAAAATRHSPDFLATSRNVYDNFMTTARAKL